MLCALTVGGLSQIAWQLEQEKVHIPTAYYTSLGRKTRKQYTDPYAWDQKTVAGILVNQQYYRLYGKLYDNHSQLQGTQDRV